MQREIKFRAWSDKDNQMTYFDLHALTEFLYRDIWNYINENKIQQFTGLKDKNGKEIYEGDIVSGVNGSINGKGMEFTITIKWIAHRAGFNIPLFKNGYNSTHYYEVIGNIYENPELLEVKE